MILLKIKNFSRLNDLAPVYRSITWVRRELFQGTLTRNGNTRRSHRFPKFVDHPLAMVGIDWLFFKSLRQVSTHPAAAPFSFYLAQLALLPGGPIQRAKPGQDGISNLSGAQQRLADQGGPAPSQSHSLSPCSLASSPERKTEKITQRESRIHHLRISTHAYDIEYRIRGRLTTTEHPSLSLLIR